MSYIIFRMKNLNDKVMTLHVEPRCTWFHLNKGDVIEVWSPEKPWPTLEVSMDGNNIYFFDESKLADCEILKNGVVLDCDVPPAYQPSPTP